MFCSATELETIFTIVTKGKLCTGPTGPASHLSELSEVDNMLLVCGQGSGVRGQVYLVWCPPAPPSWAVYQPIILLWLYFDISSSHPNS